MSETNQTAPLCAKCSKPIKERVYVSDIHGPSRVLVCGPCFNSVIEAKSKLDDTSRLSAENAELRARAERAEAERDAAVKEAARRDEKWKSGINEIVGEKLCYDPISHPGGMTLDRWIAIIQKERDEARADAAELLNTEGSLKLEQRDGIWYVMRNVWLNFAGGYSSKKLAIESVGERNLTDHPGAALLARQAEREKALRDELEAMRETLRLIVSCACCGCSCVAKGHCPPYKKANSLLATQELNAKLKGTESC